MTSYVENRWVDDAFSRPDLPGSVTPGPQLSSRHSVAVPESYRIDEFRNCRRKSQSLSSEPTG
jgi:hypothetical protein